MTDTRGWKERFDEEFKQLDGLPTGLGRSEFDDVKSFIIDTLKQELGTVLQEMEIRKSEEDGKLSNDNDYFIGGKIAALAETASFIEDRITRLEK